MSESAPEASARWKWRTFPVLCAFVSGLLIASIVNGRPDNTLGAIVQIAALLGLFYCLIHLFVTNVIVAGRIRRREMAEAEGVELEEDFEDELVYREEARTPKRRR